MSFRAALKTGLIWAGLGIGAAVTVVAVSRCCIPLDLPWTARQAVNLISRAVWPTSALLPPMVDSVDPSRTYLQWAIAVIANAVPYAILGLLVCALRAALHRHQR